MACLRGFVTSRNTGRKAGPGKKYILILKHSLKLNPSEFQCPRTFSKFHAEGGVDDLATEFRISSRWQLTDPTNHIQEGARRVCEHFRSRPHAVLEMDDEARRLLLGSLAAISIA